ncbi:MAG: type II secretion system protein GspG [Candidatus Omnitrophica bacterium]|nr:type II secretion system protein GspG [Candidatus Omnitrophota bacterium]MCM8777188.1 type II secretion system protein GspG [Candidatus Omnitrophota bacterium]
MKRNKKGIWLVEIVVVVLIVFILAIISLKLVGNVIQKAKVVSAKAQIAQLAQALETVKDETGYYPVFLNNLAQENPPKLHEKGWRGPYVREVPIDPWGVPYFYQIPPTTLWNSPALPREYGKPDTYTAYFESYAGKAILRIENYGVTACDITLNGVVVVYEYEFKNNPRPQIIEKEVTLQEGNNVLVWARSKPGDFLIASISASLVPSREYFILGSYGKNKVSGGKGFDADIVWDSRTYPNFQPQS